MPPQQSASGVPSTHELRQVVVERAQAVMDPRADRRERPFERVPAGVELKLGPVVVVGRPHRADDGQVVGMAAQMRPPVADLQRRSGRASCSRPAADRSWDGPCAALRRTRAGSSSGTANRASPCRGVSAIVLPAYSFSSGLGSNVSMWLMPPTRKSQMTLLALGLANWRQRPRWHSVIVRGRLRPAPASPPAPAPAKPMPTSERKRRRPFQRKGAEAAEAQRIRSHVS